VVNRSTFFALFALSLTAWLVWLSSGLSGVLDDPGPARFVGESALGFRAVPRQSLVYERIPTKRSGVPKGPVVNDCAILFDDIEEGDESRGSLAWRQKASPTLEFLAAPVFRLRSSLASAVSTQAHLISLLCRLQC
jgi:hypothetical protein